MRVFSWIALAPFRIKTNYRRRKADEVTVCPVAGYEDRVDVVSGERPMVGVRVGDLCGISTHV